MSQSLYRQILRQALALVVKHKTLWFLGFFTVLFGAGGQYEFFLTQYLNFSAGGWNAITNLWPGLTPGMAGFLAWVWELLASLPATAYLALGLFLISLWLLILLIVTAQGALILGIGEASLEKRVRLGGLIYAAYKSFWHLLMITVGTTLLAVFIIAVIGAPLIAIIAQINPDWISPALALLFFIFALPVILIFSIIAKFAVAACLLEGAAWRASISRALSLFAGHWLVAVEMELALFVIGVAAAVAFVLGAGLLALPFVALGFILGEMAYSWALSLIVTAGLALFLLLVLLAMSALAAFQNAAWTLLWLRIKDKPQASKLVRLVHGWREKYSN